MFNGAQPNWAETRVTINYLRQRAHASFCRESSVTTSGYICINCNLINISYKMNSIIFVAKTDNQYVCMQHIIYTDICDNIIVSSETQRAPVESVCARPERGTVRRVRETQRFRQHTVRDDMHCQCYRGGL